MSNIFIILCSLPGLFSCTQHVAEKKEIAEKDTIQINDTALRMDKGNWVYHSRSFTGYIKELYPNGITKTIMPVVNGKQDGLGQTFFENGKTETIRWYSNGEKDSVHSGCWPNGNKKFEYHFAKGNYNGLFKEWYSSGKALQQILYDNGTEVSGMGWRENGKLYMNFVIKDGRRYGLFNSNLCYSLKKQALGSAFTP